MRLAVILILVILGFAAPALAQGTDDDRRARELYDNGAILYEEGRYEDAIEAWLEAYRISERSLLLFNIANAQERVGLWREALETLNRYRAFAPAGERDVLDRRMANIERRVKEQEAVEAEQRAVEEEEARQAEEARAAEEAAAEEAASNATGPAKGGTAGGARPPRGFGAGLLIGGLAGAGAGGGLSALSLVKRQEIEALCKPAGDALFCPQTVAPLEAEEAQFSLAGDIALIAGGAVAGTGLILVIVDAATGRRSAVHVVPTPGGIAVAGRF